MGGRARLFAALYGSTMFAIAAMFCCSRAEQRCRDTALLEVDEHAKELECPHGQQRLRVAYVEGEDVGRVSLSAVEEVEMVTGAKIKGPGRSAMQRELAGRYVKKMAGKRRHQRPEFVPPERDKTPSFVSYEVHGNVYRAGPFRASDIVEYHRADIAGFAGVKNVRVVAESQRDHAWRVAEAKAKFDAEQRAMRKKGSSWGPCSWKSSAGEADDRTYEQRDKARNEKKRARQGRRVGPLKPTLPPSGLMLEFRRVMYRTRQQENRWIRRVKRQQLPLTKEIRAFLGVDRQGRQKDDTRRPWPSATDSPAE